MKTKLEELIGEMGDFDAFVAKCLKRGIVRPKNVFRLHWLRMRVVDKMTYQKIADDCMQKHPYRTRCPDGHFRRISERELADDGRNVCGEAGCSLPVEIEILDYLSPRVVCKAIHSLLIDFGVEGQSGE